MAVYFVTGKLGAGKSLMAVARIKDYLERGRTVATNLDLYLEHLISKKSKTCTVLRLPDQPSVEDFELMGIANDTPDESKNGLLVLDERRV